MRSERNIDFIIILLESELKEIFTEWIVHSRICARKKVMTNCPTHGYEEQWDITKESLVAITKLPLH